MFHEGELPKYWIFSFLILFIFLTVSTSWMPELNQVEAILTRLTKTMLETGNFFTSDVNGVQTTIPPLPAWIMSLFFRIFPINELTIRFSGICSLALLTCICSAVTYKSAGPHASAATAAAVMSSVLALKVGIFHGPDMLFGLLLNLSWLSWYGFGRVGRKWLYAWFLAHFFLFLAIITVGIKSIFFFYFPLLLLRRPLKIWLRIRQADHLLSLVFLAAFIVVWILLTPQQLEGIWGALKDQGSSRVPSSYLIQILTFPVFSLLNYFPWFFLAWPAFCIAFRPIEKDPVLGQYLRTITFGFFYFFWIFPGYDPKHLAPLLGPLGILLGLNYDILVRRHGKKLILLGKLIAWVSLLISLLFVPIYYLTKQEAIRIPPLIYHSGITILLLGFVLAVGIILSKYNFQVSFIILLSTLSLHLTFSSAFGIISYQKISQKRMLGDLLSNRLPVNVTLYEMIGEESNFAAEAYYLQRPVIKIQTVQDLPLHDQTVFVLSNNIMPISQRRSWSPLSSPIHYNDATLRIWKGERRVVELYQERLE